ncbi:Penicillin-binding protein, transpeptidase domain protein [Candidatus Magnetomorum sp. HK-1]|nr:Penicillin-binding protein, transpeptidase domain protein [Candidatus Magnetomorum sp. HK-1]
MKTNTTKLIFYLFLTLIPLFAIYRSCQITDSGHYDDQANLLVLPSEEKVAICVEFKPDADNKRGGFLMKEVSKNIMIREPGKDWTLPESGQLIVDRSFVDFGGTVYQFRQYPSAYKWTQFCNVPVTNLGIENRSAPISISFDPKSRDDRIVLNPTKTRALLSDALNQKNAPSTQIILAKMPQLLTAYNLPPIPKEKHQECLVNDLIQYLSPSFQQAWAGKSSQERETLLDNELVSVIFHHKQAIVHQLMMYLPAPLKTVFQQDTLSVEQAKAFRKWIWRHRSGKIGVRVRTLKIEDIFQVIDILQSLKQNNIPLYVVYDRYQWAVLDRLRPSISKDTIAIRKWLRISKDLAELQKNVFDDQLLVRVVSHLDISDFNQWTDQDRQLINDWFIHRALNNGRIAFIHPSEEYPVFLSTVDKGWRLQSLLPGLIHIQRISDDGALINIVPGLYQTVVLHNGDQIQMGDQVFSFNLKPTPQAISRPLNSVDFDRMGLVPLNSRAIIQEDTGLSHLSLILNSLDKNNQQGKVINGCFILANNDDHDSKTDEQLIKAHTWTLSRYQKNRLISPKGLYGLFHPAGFIPDTYTISHYSELLHEIQQAGLIQSIDGFFYLPDTSLLKFIRTQQKSPSKTSVYNSHPLTGPLTEMARTASEQRIDQWIKLIKKVDRSHAVTSAVRSANLAYRPAGFAFLGNLFGKPITSDPTWTWKDKAIWHSASFRQDLCPIAKTDIRQHWIWDMHPWYPESKHQIHRVFQKSFTPGLDNQWLSPELTIIACGEPHLLLNGKAIPLITADGPEKPVRTWHLDNTESLISAIKWEKRNLFQLEIINDPPKRTFANYVGLQIALSRANDKDHPVITSDIHWEASNGYYFQWQEEDRGRWDNVITQAPYLMPPGLPDIPVIWKKELQAWKTYQSINNKRYFRRKFQWPGGDAFIEVYSNDPVTVYLNGKSLSLSKGQTIIPRGLFKQNSDNILAISVNNRFYQPLSRQNSPGLFISPQSGQLCMSAYSFRQNNPYHQSDNKKARGQFFDCDRRSLPKLRLIAGHDDLMQKGDEIPLARSFEDTHYIKDLLFIYQPVPDIHLVDLPGKKDGYIRLQWSQKDAGIRILDRCGSIMPDNKAYSYYSVFKNYPHGIQKEPWWEPDDPSKFQDLTPVGINISNVPNMIFQYDRAQIPLNIQWKDNLNLVQKSLTYTHFYPSAPLSKQKDIDQDGINPQFKLGELLIVDLVGHAYHAFEIDDYQKLASRKQQNKIFNTPAIRFKQSKDRHMQLIVSGDFSRSYSLTVNNHAIPEQGYTLHAGDQIHVGNYCFEYIPDGHGVLAGNKMVNGHEERYYPPGLGLSHTVGTYFPNHHNGLERVMDTVLEGKWTPDHEKSPHIQLTIDDDLCRIIRDEVNRQITIIDRRYAYQLQSLKQLLSKSKTPVQKEFYSTQINTIQKSRQRYGMLVVLNENSEILAAISEPSVESSPSSFQKFQKDISETLINRALHDARFRPGSSFKLVTAMAGFEYGRDDLIQASELLYKGWRFNFTRQLNTTQINNKNIIVDLENHKRHGMKRGTAFAEALKKSHNVWFAYLGLLLNRSVVHRSYFLPGDAYHAFVSPHDRIMDYSLLKQAERIGFNKNLALYRLSYDNSQLMDPELFFNRNPDITDDPLTLAASRFPVQTLDQRSIARMAIGQHTVTETPVMNAMIALSLSPKWAGNRPSPRIIKSIFSDDLGELAKDAGPEIKRICSTSAAKAIRDAMHQVVIKGTGGQVFRTSPLRNKLYGKTGTSERGKAGLFDNSWWTCFIEAPNGKVYAISACFPDAGEGAHHAADCVKRVLDKMWRYYGW